MDFHLKGAGPSLMLQHTSFSQNGHCAIFGNKLLAKQVMKVFSPYQYTSLYVELTLKKEQKNILIML